MRFRLMSIFSSTSSPKMTVSWKASKAAHGGPSKLGSPTADGYRRPRLNAHYEYSPSRLRLKRPIRPGPRPRRLGKGMTTTTTDHPSRIGYLLLVRLLIVADKGETTAKIRKDIEPLLAHQSQAMHRTIESALALSELESSGLISVIRGKRKNSIPKIALTISGRQRRLSNSLASRHSRPERPGRS